MDNQPFSNRELTAKFDALHDLATETLAQAKKTNGRVSKLEDWKAFMQGGLAILALMIVPIFIYFLTHWSK